MGKMLAVLTDVHVAGQPTFIPAADGDPNKHHTMVTVINNRGKSKSGAELRDEVTLNFWGKYAQVAACHLDKGRKINVEGEIMSHTIDTGQVRPDGKKVLHRRNEIRVNTMTFGGDTRKELVARINTNLAAAKASGRLDPAATITAEDLIAIQRSATVDYNPALAAQTGRYGNAKVYFKGGAPTFAQPVQPAAPVQNQAIDAMKAELAALKAMLAAGQGQSGAAAVDPFNASK